MEGTVQMHFLSQDGPYGYFDTALDTSLTHLRATVAALASVSDARNCTGPCWAGVKDRPGQLYVALSVAPCGTLKRIVTGLSGGTLSLLLTQTYCSLNPRGGHIMLGLPGFTLFAIPLSRLPHGQKLTVTLDYSGDINHTGRSTTSIFLS